MQLDADVGRGPDHDLLEVAHEPHRVGPSAEIEHGVPDELSGPVERERAAAVDEPEDADKVFFLAFLGFIPGLIGEEFLLLRRSAALPKRSISAGSPAAPRARLT